VDGPIGRHGIYEYAIEGVCPIGMLHSRYLKRRWHSPCGSVRIALTQTMYADMAGWLAGWYMAAKLAVGVETCCRSRRLNCYVYR
jgi:hypothetical protein